MSIRPLLLALILMVQSDLAAAASHCASSEIAYFSCQVKHSTNVISLCGATKRNPDNAVNNKILWLQYRFGSLGHPSLIFPPKKSESLKRFHGYSTYSSMGQFSIDEVSFESIGFTYRINKTEVERTGPSADDMDNFTGVYVTRENKDIARFACADLQQVQTNLSEAVLAVMSE